VDRRTILGDNRPDFIAGKDVVENLMLFQAIEEPQQQTFAHRRFRFIGGTGIEQTLGVVRFVEVFAEFSGGGAFRVKRISAYSRRDGGAPGDSDT